MVHRESSPFQTSHDTLGMSSMNTPMFMASSPPKTTSPYSQSEAYRLGRFSPSPSRTGRSHKSQNSVNQRSSASVYSSDASDSEAHLSDYTFDLNKLPNAGAGSGNNAKKAIASKSPLKTNENGFEPGGPEDFTLNMVELLKGIHPDDERDNREETHKEDEDIDGPSTRAAHDEFSEIEPPSEMSTPIHVLSRKEDLTTHDIQEDKTEFFPEAEQLRKELRKKDEIISANQRRILDAASIVQQVRHLQAELQKERDLRLGESASKDERIRDLENQLHAQDERLKGNQSGLQEFESLRSEVDRLRQQPREFRSNGDNTEVYSLRERLEEKEKLLHEANARLDETMATHQRQLSEKAAEYSQLRSEQDRHKYALDQLDSDVESLVRERDVLHKRTQDLDKLVQHLESQVARLQENLSMGRTEALSKAEALRKVAERISLDVNGKSFSQILELFEQAYQSKRDQTIPEVSATKNEAESGKASKELVDTRTQLQEATSLNRILSLELDSAREELSESRRALSTVREESSRLSSQLESVNFERTQLRQDLEKATQERDEAANTVTNLRQQIVAQQLPSPAPSPPRFAHATQCQHDIASIEKYHQQGIERIENNHATEISTLRDTHAESARNLHALLRAAQDRECELQSELVELRKSSASKAKELAVQMAEQERLESVIEAKDAAAAALDLKFASVLKKREAVWESRIEKLLHERERMGKALLWTWGEKEVGQEKQDTSSKLGHAQGYRYKYVDRPKSAK